MDRGPQVKDVVADGQVVLEAEGLQHHAIPHREREPQLVVVVGWAGEPQVSRSPVPPWARTSVGSGEVGGARVPT